jgi:hypothetical protein
MKKFAFIIDTYPGSEEEMSILLDNIKKIKSEGIDILLTSHHPLNREIIESVDYFIFEKKNDQHFLDSEILNRDLSKLTSPVYTSYASFANRTYVNGVVHTSFSVSVVSQMFNSVKFLYSKGYDFAFYIVSDFKYPDSGFSHKIKDIFDRIPEGGNYFTYNHPMFPSWFAPFFFGFTLKEDLIKRIPDLDFSDINVYQEHYLNMSAEDIIIKIWSADTNNVIDPYEKLKEIFDGEGNWNTSDSGTTRPGNSSLVFHCFSDIYVNEKIVDPQFEGEKFSLFLSNLSNSPFEIVVFTIILSDEFGNIFYHVTREVNRGMVFFDRLDPYLAGKRKIRVDKEISSKNEDNIFIKDSVSIDLENIGGYAMLKKFVDSE